MHRVHIVDQIGPTEPTELVTPRPHGDGIKGANLDTEVAVHAKVVIDDEPLGPACLPFSLSTEVWSGRAGSMPGWEAGAFPQGTGPLLPG
jgi:hypothetical protein